jgi:hypothetical protein
MVILPSKTIPMLISSVQGNKIYDYSFLVGR